MKILGNSIIATLIIAFIIGQFFPNQFLVVVYTVLTAVVAIVSLKYSKGLPRMFGIVMVLLGSSIFLYQQQPLGIWAEGITKNLPLVCLVVIVPILGIPIGLGNYHQHLAGAISRFNRKPDLLYLLITGLFSLIGPITNLGSLYIIHAMLENVKPPNALLGRAYVRGFTSVHTWSPYFASVILVVYSLNIPIYQYLPYGIILSFFQISVAYYLFRYVEMRHIKVKDFESGQYINIKMLYELFAVLLLLTGFIFLFEPFVQLNASVLISIIVLVFAFLWTAYLCFLKHFFKEINEYRKKILPGKANEVNLLLTAGFFGVVLSKTPISNYIHSVWVGLANKSVFLLIIMTITIIAFFSFIGVHQIVTISAIVATVSYDQLAVHGLVMAMMLLSAWGVATTISPISPVTTAVSSLIKENVFKITIRWNLLYAIFLLLVHSIVIYCIHLFLFS
ncbi:hypothetical protein D4T97_017455 [Siminovitchia acidinfaciens]|uniref:C4-dicarboxylate ABC transporter n=1 Tax=Siminovitchia acidinfaciens TaxID=2321395 RepID=A0A429XV52_9BACI|nr:hypothetical protein [Siminovitchia acidinfaciens]RST72048.1 hypothetical protein D4T97_017455 [Siminovitchia acidinfaciens]